jgi:capsid protein
MSWLGDKWDGLKRRLFGPMQTNLVAPIPDGSSGPTDPRILAQGAQPDWMLELGWSRRYTVDRAQQLQRANMLAGALLERNADHVVGPGFGLRARTGDSGFNLESRLRWEEWAGTPNLCDSRARHRFMPTMVRHYQIGAMRDGDSAWLLKKDGRVRHVGSIEIASPVGAYWRTTEADGVETDLDGKHLAYWIHQPDEVPYPNVRVALQTLVKVPAKDVVFYARTPLGPAQTRGTTAFLGAFRPFERIDGTIMSVADKAEIAARLAMLVIKKSPLPSTQIGGRSTPLTEIKEGALTRLEQDEDIRPVQGADPSTDLIEFARFIVRIVGTRFGQALASILLDHSDHNFSNARASAMETNLIILLQQIELAFMVGEVRNMKTIEWIRNGELGRKLRRRADLMPEDTMRRALRHKWSLPARPLVDPLKERQADLLAYDMGATTLTDILAREGKTVGEVFRMQRREREKAKNYGLPLETIRSNLTREQMETIVTSNGTDDGDDDVKKDSKNRGKNGTHFELQIG